MKTELIKNRSKFEDDLNQIGHFETLDETIKFLYNNYKSQSKLDLAKELIITYFDDLSLVTLIEFILNEEDRNIIFPLDNLLCQNKFKLDILNGIYHYYVNTKYEFTSIFTTFNTDIEFKQIAMNGEIANLKSRCEMLEIKINELEKKLNG